MVANFLSRSVDVERFGKSLERFAKSFYKVLLNYTILSMTVAVDMP